MIQFIIIGQIDCSWIMTNAVSDGQLGPGTPLESKLFPGCMYYIIGDATDPYRNTTTLIAPVPSPL